VSASEAEQKKRDIISLKKLRRIYNQNIKNILKQYSEYKEKQSRAKKNCKKTKLT